MFAYFSSEFVSEYNNAYYSAKSQYQKDLDSLKISRNNLLQLETENNVVVKYQQDYAQKNSSKKLFTAEINNSKIFGFNDNWHFAYIFGRNICWLVASYFLFFWLLTRAKKHEGIITFLTTTSTLATFEMYWIFQPLQDVSKAAYFVIALLSVLLIYLGFLYTKKYNLGTIGKLKATNRDLQHQKEKLLIHAIVNTPDSKKKQEVLSFLEKYQ